MYCVSFICLFIHLLLVFHYFGFWKAELLWLSYDYAIWHILHRHRFGPEQHKKCQNHSVRWSPVPWAFSWWSASVMPRLFLYVFCTFLRNRGTESMCCCLIFLCRLVQTGMPAVCDRVAGGCCCLIFLDGRLYIRSQQWAWLTAHTARLALCVLSHFLLAAWRCVCGQPLRCAPWRAVTRARACHVLFTVKKKEKKRKVKELCKTKIKKNTQHTEAVRHKSIIPPSTILACCKKINKNHLKVEEYSCTCWQLQPLRAAQRYGTRQRCQWGLVCRLTPRRCWLPSG